MAVRKKFGSALGRGLDALISTEDVRTEGSSTINEIDISLIERNPNQPRREFDEDALQELADSIAEIGNGAFNTCPLLVSLSLPDDVYINGNPFTPAQILYVNAGSDAEQWAIRNMHRFQRNGEGDTTIVDGVLYNYSGTARRLTLNSITKINPGAVARNLSLEQVDLPEAFLFQQHFRCCQKLL